MAAGPRLLCVPVSGPFGMGEYARSLAIASAVRARWPDAEVHFALSRAAPYAATTPFPTTLFDSSPTFHTPQVLALLESFRPTIALFDNAGRTAQLRAAQRCGARVIYISARRRQRRKAFRWRWLGLLDEHWIAYPQFIAGSLSWLERLKLRLRGRPRLRFLDVILPATNAESGAALLARFAVSAGDYALFVPGGGTGHPNAAGAVAAFHTAAEQLAQSGIPTVFVGPTAVDGAPVAGLRACASLPQTELAALMRSARLIVANGGSTLLQAIACGRANLAIPIAKDQYERIRRCVTAGVTQSTILSAERIAQQAQNLWSDEAARRALEAHAAALGLADGIEVALAAIARLHEGNVRRSATST